MGVSKRLSGAAGVQQNAVLMGSPANKALLADIGIQDPELDGAGPSDLVVAVIAATPVEVDEALGRLDEFLLGGVQSAETSNPHSLEEGLARQPRANLAVISIPGEYAAREARKALESGLNVFLFSDNVSIQDELELKQFARAHSLLVMGPDCGTSLVGGVGIGFANAVRRGHIGVIGAAGTGLQEFTTQVHNAGLGISHAIGTGSHDLSDQVGGLTTLSALDALEADPHTTLIAVISKPPGAKTLASLEGRFKTCRKPVVCCFPGVKHGPEEAGAHVRHASTLDEAVALSIDPASGGPAAAPAWTPAQQAWMEEAKARRAPGQKYLRGLFAGGTFCYQAQQILGDAGLQVYSNGPLDPRNRLADPNCSLEHSVVDLGADEFMVGRPHPMIDGTVRAQRILAEARDPQLAVLLLDIILGYNASTDPAGELIDSILQARQIVKERGGELPVVASLCATDGDPQDAALQARLLQDAGVLVFGTSARAVYFCRELLL
jgi:succinyl-CoA synthetase alpha subunit